MSLEQLDQFRQVVLDDPALQKALRTTSDHESFVSLLLQLGQAHGYAFTSDEVRAALQAARRSWRKQI